MYAKCRQKRCREINEANWLTPRAVFVPAVAIQTKFSLFSKFSINLGSMPKMFTYVLSTSRKHTTRFHVRSFGECCGSTVLTAACYGRQGTVFLLRRLCPCWRSKVATIHRWCWTPTRVCAVTTPLRSLYTLDTQLSTSISLLDAARPTVWHC